MPEEKLNSFESAIKAYLDKRAESDSVFAAKYTQENKSIQDCCKYIINEVKKQKKSGENCVAMSDEKVYGMAVHFYDEDDIVVDDAPTQVEVQTTPEPPPTPEAKPKTRKPRAKKETDENIPIQLDIPLFKLT